MEDVYYTIEKESTGLFKDKGSKFYAFAYPLRNEENVKEILSILRKEHHSARHYCYAWRLGTKEITYRANDDGEPPSTAGKPILGQLQSFNVTNILVVVVRYFGGTLLGTGGLISAYRSAAADALKNAEIVEKIIEKEIILDFTYNELSEVMNVIKQENLSILKTRFEERCDLTFSVRETEYEKVKLIFNNIYGVGVKIIT
ncbi:YigZ family protein [Draconibacterium sp.]